MDDSAHTDERSAGPRRTWPVVLIVCLTLSLLLVGAVVGVGIAMRREIAPVRIDDFLPADRGLAAAPSDTRPTMVVGLAMPDGVLDVSIDGAALPEGAEGMDEAVRRRVATFVAAHPDPDEPVVTIAAEADVPTPAVVRAVDAAIAGGARDVTFEGVPPVGSTLDRMRQRNRR